MTRTITAFYDTRSEAQAAVDRLIEIGVAPGALSIHDSSSTTETTTAATPARHEEKGFWASLGDLFVPDEDRYSYEEGIRRGGSVLTVRAEETEFDRISDILEDTGSVDLDTRETQWKSEGWSGYETTGRTGTLADDPTISDRSYTAGSTGLATSATADLGTGARLGRTQAATDADRDRDGTIEVVEENLRVGKRDVSHGRVRVRSYVVEDAVSQDVNLRNERVEIERRAVDRPVSSLDAAFRDQTIELEETAEEAVVSKDARVTEEIDLSRIAENRTETVSDTVRRTEVEIEDERVGRAGSGAAVTDEELARKRRGL